MPVANRNELPEIYETRLNGESHDIHSLLKLRPSVL